MDYQRIFILLGLAVTAYMLILAWNEDYGQGAPRETAIEQAPVTDGNTVPDMPAPAVTGSGADGTDVPVLETSETRQAVSAEPASRQMIQVRTDVLDVTIDPVGGDIVRVSLPAYPTTLDMPDEPFLLVDPRNAYVAQSGLIGPDGTDRQGRRPLFESDQTHYTLNDADELVVTLSHRQETGATVIKTFTFRKSDYLIDMEYRIENTTTAPWQGALFTQIKRDSQDPHSTSGNLMGMQPYVGGATRSETELYSKLQFDDLEDDSFKETRTDGYMAMVQHYFISAWVPTQGQEVTFTARKLKDRDIYLLGFTTQTIQIQPGEIGSLAARYYAGPKDQYRLQEIAPGLDLTVDYGFLWWLAQPMFYLLTMIHDLVQNWGIAIICLTIIVKSLLYPLSAASFRSMAKMRKLQPEMVRLKERYGDDRQKFSQEMMELYKKEGANPLGGCFPILLQMPVFLALYWCLMESVELRQAPFFLWIEDLSAMDPYFVLPILMGVSMYVTQMLQPEPPDPVQAKVFKLMPIMFTFFFLWFPSGLVLYWLVNNCLSILQQLYVTRQIEKAG
ncbi:MAG: membrane protein insertase YidC [Proteobacteria bacterium]|nr:membrane protein insertase YidC [Pseudomonadota bacterium]